MYFPSKQETIDPPLARTIKLGRRSEPVREACLPFTSFLSDAPLRLFCFPCAGGSASNLRELCSALPSNIQGCSVQLPGRGTRFEEALVPEITTLVQSLQTELLPFMNQPFALLGHSFGGKIAFELTRLLRANRQAMPEHLFISSCSAPHLPNEDPPIDALTDAEFLMYLRRYNGLPRTVSENAELMDILLPALRADFTALHRYEYSPQEPLPVPITVMSGLGDTTVPASQLEEWSRYTTCSFRLALARGDHFFIQSDPVQVVNIIVRSLARQSDPE